jgi:hypothetical protein
MARWASCGWPRTWWRRRCGGASPTACGLGWTLAGVWSIPARARRRRRACCKQCVAVALRWLRGHDGADDGEELRTYLHGLGADGLVELVVEQAGMD